MKQNLKNTATLFLLTTLFGAGCSPILAQKNLRTVTPAIERMTQTLPLVPTSTINTHSISGATLKDTLPGEPQGSSQVIHDQSSAATAKQKKAPGGDVYSLGRFERPFDQQMVYLPALDMVRAELFRPSDGWIYFKISLEATPAPPPAVYGVELDLNIDGRGDLLIQALAPSSKEWSEAGIKMWWDSDGDVGGRVINRSDPRKFRGSGFETLKIDSDANKSSGQIWTRLQKVPNLGMEIAMREDLIGGKDGKFSWKPYTDGVPFPPSQYDLNDYYLLEEAGSPIMGERDYPLKAVYAVDNTCKGLSGLAPSGLEQGVCPP
ncbi:MAG TPA: hypothetical protein VF338_03665 [Leptolinea sp.]